MKCVLMKRFHFFKRGKGFKLLQNELQIVKPLLQLLKHLYLVQPESLVKLKPFSCSIFNNRICCAV